jgi:hypothetical protein
MGVVSQRSGGAPAQRGGYNNRPALAPYRLGFFNSLSLIERAFPLWCLGNNILEFLPKGEGEDENAWAPVYCKEASRTPH